MQLYHGTPTENLESIMTKGLIPHPNFRSEHLSVISLTTSPELAIIHALNVDFTKVARGQKDYAQSYVALEVDVGKYPTETAQDGVDDEFWILEKIKHRDIRVVRIEKFESAIRIVEDYVGKH